ncbi:MAG: DUF3592 domain-containing protein [Candidatus Adiutrix sp.]|jgi:hypothetical protein|nr:DUF3592 domain-containing protein [Candidatus Adiutrix sp.]
MPFFSESMTKGTWPMIIGIVLIAMGLWEVGTGILRDSEFNKFQAEAAVGTAVIGEIKHEEVRRQWGRKHRKRTEDRYTHHLLYEINGTQYSAEKTLRHALGKTGGEVTILYRPENPREVHLGKAVEAESGFPKSTLYLCFGFLLTVLGIRNRQKYKEWEDFGESD